jgi:energy-coupling factor transporter transmembrane protein EcfT
LVGCWLFCFVLFCFVCLFVCLFVLFVCLFVVVVVVVLCVLWAFCFALLLFVSFRSMLFFFFFSFFFLFRQCSCLHLNHLAPTEDMEANEEQAEERVLSAIFSRVESDGRQLRIELEPGVWLVVKRDQNYPKGHGTIASLEGVKEATIRRFGADSPKLIAMLVSRGSVFCYDLAMDAARYLDDEGATEEDLLLRESCEAVLLKQSLNLDTSMDLRASSSALVLALQEQVAEVRADKPIEVGKRRMCVVCNVQVPKELKKINDRFYCKNHRCSVCDCPVNKNGITVANETRCPTHAKSSSSRFLVELKKEEGRSASSRFQAALQLLTMLSRDAESGRLSGVDLMAVHAVLVPSHKFSMSQFETLAKLSKAGSVERSLPEARERALQLIESFQERLEILDCQISWIRMFFQNSSSGFEEQSLETEQIRVISMLYDSFRLVEPEYQEKLLGIVCCVFVTLKGGSDNVVLELKFSFFEGAKKTTKFEFQSSSGLSTGDLLCLSNMLGLPGNESFSALSLINTAQAFLTEVCEVREKPEAAFELDVFDEKLALVPTVQSKKVRRASWKEVEVLGMKALSESVKQSGFDLIHVENVVSRPTWERFAKEELEGNLQSFCGWHGSPDQVDSIIENGLLAPFDLTNKGEMIRVRHGSMFGQGIYVGLSLNTSHNYAFRGAHGVSQAFFVICRPGRAKFLDAKSEEFFQKWNKPILECANEW